MSKDIYNSYIFTPEEIEIIERNKNRDDTFWKQQFEELKQQLAELQDKYNASRECIKLLVEDKDEMFENHIQELIKLEQKLTEKDKEIKSLKEEIEDERDFKNEYYKYWQDLKKEMTKKNKEIGELKFKLANKRHQICEEIRQYDMKTNKQKTGYTEYVEGLWKKLKQIEKGEEENV